jgi:hypothetical protein
MERLPFDEYSFPEFKRTTELYPIISILDVERNVESDYEIPPLKPTVTLLSAIGQSLPVDPLRAKLLSIIHLSRKGKWADVVAGMAMQVWIASGRRFEKIDFRSCAISLANLDQAEFVDCRFEGCVFHTCDLGRASFDNDCTLLRSAFVNCRTPKTLMIENVGGWNNMVVYWLDLVTFRRLSYATGYKYLPNKPFVVDGQLCDFDKGQLLLICKPDPVSSPLKEFRKADDWDIDPMVLGPIVYRPEAWNESKMEWVDSPVQEQFTPCSLDSHTSVAFGPSIVYPLPKDEVFQVVVGQIAYLFVFTRGEALATVDRCGFRVVYCYFPFKIQSMICRTDGRNRVWFALCNFDKFDSTFYLYEVDRDRFEEVAIPRWLKIYSFCYCQESLWFVSSVDTLRVWHYDIVADVWKHAFTNLDDVQAYRLGVVNDNILLIGGKGQTVSFYWFDVDRWEFFGVGSFLLPFRNLLKTVDWFTMDGVEFDRPKKRKCWVIEPMLIEN